MRIIFNYFTYFLFTNVISMIALYQIEEQLYVETMEPVIVIEIKAAVIESIGHRMRELEPGVISGQQGHTASHCKLSDKPI